jgi:hypothetical protein
MHWRKGCAQDSMLANIILVYTVLDPEKGVCADPVDKGAILGKGGANPHSSDKERQLAPDIGREKT